MRVIVFPEDGGARDAAAAMLNEAFPWPTGWPTIDEAREEVDEARGDDRICLAAVDGDGALIGWVGAHDAGYDGRVWELHPLVVRAEARGRGVGRALVARVEEEAARRGATILWVGTGDEQGATSLAGVDLFPRPLDHLARLRAVRTHPVTFYLHLGYALAGVVPDANGPGSHDLFLAKRLAR